MIRRATLEDLDVLADLETRCFGDYRISRASFRRLIRRDTASVFVEQEAAGAPVRGSAVVLFRRGLAAARLYSIAVDPDQRGSGIGRALLAAAIDEAVAHDRPILRLEVREDNAAAIALYESQGFNRAGRIPDYYPDGTAALRYERSVILNQEPPRSLDIPYYQQTLDFTCGAACLLMALKHFSPDTTADRMAELTLWREATTIFMTSGIGGCSAEGLALAAHRRGLQARVVTTEQAVPFIDSVRSPEKKEVVRLVHESFLDALSAAGHRREIRSFDRTDLRAAVDAGQVPILLVSGYRLYGAKIPHWVVVTGYDDHFIYIHDPYVPEDAPNFRGRHVPIAEPDFTRMHRYGRGGQRTVIFLSSEE